ncbi:hypothetical protein EVB53_004 [Rhizobium phage RHph_Y60]|nr:hypothetical protein EVB53_004 [Rhizobium phage RHph_Y60]
MMDKIGRITIGGVICAAVWFVAREIWNFPLDEPTFWFATFYGMASSVIMSMVKK